MQIKTITYHFTVNKLRGKKTEESDGTKFWRGCGEMKTHIVGKCVKWHILRFVTTWHYDIGQHVQELQIYKSYKPDMLTLSTYVEKNSHEHKEAIKSCMRHYCI